MEPRNFADMPIVPNPPPVPPAKVAFWHGLTASEIFVIQKVEGYHEHITILGYATSEDAARRVVATLTEEDVRNLNESDDDSFELSSFSFERVPLAVVTEGTT